MALDTLIDYDCAPKQALGAPGILERLKARERAATIIRLYRRNGDQRSPRDMGFEMVRSAADGSEETQVVVVQHLLDSAAELDPLAPHCAGCPANRSGAPLRLHRPHQLSDFALRRGLPAQPPAGTAHRAAGLAAAEAGHPRLQV